MNDSGIPRLSKREGEILEILYRLGTGGVAEVQAAMTRRPGYSSVRKQLEILEEKGYVRHRKEGRRYVYEPTVPREEAAAGALSRVVRSFFRGDAEAAMVSLLSLTERVPDEERLEQIRRAAEASRGAE